MEKPFILIKLSGAALGDEQNIFSEDKIINIGYQIKALQKKYKIGIVIGGGNIYRGNFASNIINKSDADYMGMLSTLINCIFVENIFKSLKLNTITLSNIQIDRIRPTFTYHVANEYLNNDYICLFACGTGNPYFSTDSGAALKACELNAKFILMGKDGVDGVYNADPYKNKDAIRYNNLTYNDVIENNLKVMDLTAITLCKESKIKIIVFNLQHKDSLIKALTNEILTTIIE